MVVMACVGYLHGNVIRQRICGLVQSAGYLILNTVSVVGFVLCCVLLRGNYWARCEEEEEPYLQVY